jgi:hypothetical protein
VRTVGEANLVYDFADGWINGVFNETSYGRNGQTFGSPTSQTPTWH